jgi:hypothetical protein
MSRISNPAKELRPTRISLGVGNAFPRMTGTFARLTICASLAPPNSQLHNIALSLTVARIGGVFAGWSAVRHNF